MQGQASSRRPEGEGSPPREFCELASLWSFVIPRCAIARLMAREARTRNPSGRKVCGEMDSGLMLRMPRNDGDGERTGKRRSPQPPPPDRIAPCPITLRIARYFLLSANTQITPPCGTLFSKPATLPASASWMRCASTPQPDCTAMYCVPSTS